jgi:hypothetical protein
MLLKGTRYSSDTLSPSALGCAKRRWCAGAGLRPQTRQGSLRGAPFRGCASPSGSAADRVVIRADRGLRLFEQGHRPAVPKLGIYCSHYGNMLSFADEDRGAPHACLVTSILKAEQRCNTGSMSPRRRGGSPHRMLSAHFRRQSGSTASACVSKSPAAVIG